MNFKIPFDRNKCEQLHISNEIIQFWEKGNGAEFIKKSIEPFLNVLNIGDFIACKEHTYERDFYVDFKTMLL